MAISKFFGSFQKAGINSDGQISKSICEAAIRAIDANFCRKMPNDMKYFLMFSDLEYLIYLESY